MESEELPKQEKKVAITIILGFFIALVAMGLPMIGVSVNLWLGAFVLLVAFFLLAYGIWKWETAGRWGQVARVNTLWVLGVVYFALIGLQILGQYRKDHPMAVVNTSKPSLTPPVSQPQSAPAITPPPKSEKRIAVAKPKPAQISAPVQPTTSTTTTASTASQTPEVPPQVVCSGGSSCGVSSGQTGGITAGTYIGPVEPQVSHKVTYSGGTAQIDVWVDKPYPNAKFAVQCDRPCRAVDAKVDWRGNDPKLRMFPEADWGTAGNPPEPNIAAFIVYHPETFGTEITLKCTVKSNDDLPFTIISVGRLTVTPPH